MIMFHVYMLLIGVSVQTRSRG